MVIATENKAEVVKKTKEAETKPKKTTRNKETK